ncbi:hypothetical protein Nepgr_008213 [Nepenthes gracilis]|uniref:Molybdate-anion transporter n=1 Tax=Nepenthes gracilis TaxID=150966 RepID=A0AAD3XJ17_NEPGR|nr:hypothetical protein Nepgr_008213 [Nepenthes gracilis]
MGVVIESEIWEPNATIYIFLLIACFVAIFLLPHFSNPTTASPFDLNISSSFLQFQRKFLLLYFLSSVLEGFWSVFGEYEMANYGVSRENMALSLCVGCLASLFAGTFLGMLSDVVGQKKVCFIFCILHLFVGIWKRVITHPSIWVASICLSLASSIFSFSFETWVVVEHEKLGYRQDTLNVTFWLMTFSESASLIGSQMLANWIARNGLEKSVVSPSTVSVFLAMITVIFVARGWTESPVKEGLNAYRASFTAYIFGDKQIWLLALAQACLHFSIAVFWILWAPTIVADGREVHLGLIYPSLLGSRMLGSTLFPWFINELASIRTEDCILYTFIFAGLVLSIVAYDYQEIGVLVLLFCLFHICAGLMLPSLARLRTMYVPNEFRAGMMSLSLAPANAALLLVVLNGGYYRNICNATIMAFAALGLLVAAGCISMQSECIYIHVGGKNEGCEQDNLQKWILALPLTDYGAVKRAKYR